MGNFQSVNHPTTSQIVSRTMDGTLTTSPTSTSSHLQFLGIAPFAGPNLLGALIQSFETGIIFGQAMRFWSRSQRESVTVKTCVAYVVVVSFLRPSFSFLEVWNGLVLNFGDFVGASSPRWGSKFQPIMNVLLVAPLEGLLIWRCWLLTGKPTVLLVIFVAAYLASIAFPIVQVHEVFSAEFELVFIGITSNLAKNIKPPSYQLEPILVCLHVIPEVPDVALSTIPVDFFPIMQERCP
ncbi:hypothetical protein SCHPADRAFT_945689 [Schizopora paradoxa]|uniref:Uncharacterized protein n=1 Tax=Schizopora paradoxa TaxID=27342 RepID=A0A0H2R531_9AGAM|nr:hypothetical protein SCHPADRAFT_945689 [Schizopora paradoxa]